MPPIATGVKDKQERHQSIAHDDIVQRFNALSKKSRLGKWQKFKACIRGKDPTEHNEEDTVQRRFLIDESNVAPHVKGKKKKVRKSLIEENFYDIVDVDDRHAEELAYEKFISGFLDSTPYQMFMAFVIAFNALVIGIRTDDNLNSRYLVFFDICDEIILGVYMTEILLKWYCGFLLFFKSTWNIFDLIIVFLMMSGDQYQHFSSLKILRVLRVLHYLRGLPGMRMFSGMEILVDSVLKSIPDMLTIGILLVIVLAILAVAAVNIFGTVKPELFGSFGLALFALFSNLTLDGVVLMYDKFANETLWAQIGIAILIIINVCVGAFIFLNLIVAVAANTLEQMSEEKSSTYVVKQQIEPESVEELASEVNQNAPVAQFNKFHKHIDLLKLQRPMQLADFKGLTIDKLEKYLVLLAALDENLTEYQGLKTDMKKIYDIVKNINIIETIEEYDDDMSQSYRDSTIGPGRNSSIRSSVHKSIQPILDNSKVRTSIVSNLARKSGGNKH